MKTCHIDLGILDHYYAEEALGTLPEREPIQCLQYGCEHAPHCHDCYRCLIHCRCHSADTRDTRHGGRKGTRR